MVLGIFRCCLGCCQNTESLRREGEDRLWEGAKILESQPKILQKQRAYELVAKGILYLKLAEAEEVGIPIGIHGEETWGPFAVRLIASFCESSICSQELKNYLFEQGVFDEEEYRKYVLIFQNKGPVWFNPTKQLSLSENGRISRIYRTPREYIELAKKSRLLEINAKKAKEYFRKMEQEDAKKEIEEREAARIKKELKIQERDDYEKIHPEVKYQREAAEAAREQVELLRKKGKEANEQTRLLENIAHDTDVLRSKALRMPPYT